MKKYIRTLFSVSLLALGVSSCTDLDVDIKSQLTEYPDSEIAAEAKMANVYYSLRGDWGRRYREVMALSSGEYTPISFDGDYVDDYNYSNPALHKSNPNDPCVGHFGNASSGITLCNKAIVELGGEDAAAAAPALAMRAFYHFVLMDSYGDVPLLKYVPEENEAVERAPRAEVARFIEADLLKALPNLNEASDRSTYGKPNRWMAEALLVKLYINWNVYTCGDITQYNPTATNEKLNDCIAHCDEIIKSGLFDLNFDYCQKFWPENTDQNIRDFIYVMPYTSVNKDGMQYGRPMVWRKGDKDGNGGAGYMGEELPKSCGGNFTVTPETSDLFCLEGDRRNDVIIKGQIFKFDPITRKAINEPWLYKGEPVILSRTITLVENKDSEGNPIPLTTFNTGSNVYGWSQGYRSVKWWVVADDYKNDRNQSNDVPIFRYADILLTKAEAILRGGQATNGDTPTSLMNQIRTYVNAPAIASATLPELLDERGREFFDENWRRNDLIRFGNFEDDWGLKHELNPSAKTNYNARLLPIPKGIMDLNTNWKQNPGY